MAELSLFVIIIAYFHFSSFIERFRGRTGRENTGEVPACRQLKPGFSQHKWVEKNLRFISNWQLSD